MNLSGTHDDNTVIVDACGDIVVVHGWQDILRVRLQVDSDVETFTGIGWRVYGHPGWMERAEPRWSRGARGMLDPGNRSPQSKGRNGGRWRGDIVEMAVWGQGTQESGRPDVRDV